MRIALDKQAHFLGGYALGLTGGLASPFLGLGISVVAALGKEWYDKKHPDKHTADWLDAAYTIVGGIIGSSVSFII